VVPKLTVGVRFPSPAPPCSAVMCAVTAARIASQSITLTGLPRRRPPD